MEPLGTITMCLPYVDKETHETLLSMMKEAENFADFTEKLNTLACTQSTTKLTEYFAFFFPFHINDYQLTDKLISAGKAPDLAAPLVLVCKYRRGDLVLWEDMLQALIKALKAAPNDWVATHIYTKWRYYVEFHFPESDTDVKPIQRIEERVNEDKNLEYFKSYLLRFEAIKCMLNMSVREEIELIEQALTIARKYDEQVVIADLLSALSEAVPDEERGIELLRASTELSERLGYRYKIGHNRFRLGNKLGNRGEFNSAVENILEFTRVRESLDLPVITPNGYLAAWYNIMGDGVNALKRTEAALEAIQESRRLTSYMLAQKAWALVNLGRNDEARVNLEISRELAVKSGVAWYWFVYNQLAEGILYKAEGNFDGGIVAFEDVLQYPGVAAVPSLQAICLINLTDIEIERASPDDVGDSSGQWMEKLEEFVETRKSPGFEARLLLLKARLCQKQGRIDEAQSILRRVRQIAEAPSLKYLNSLIAPMSVDS